ncbi:DUF5677 domain-containing protein [Granulicella sp. S190]|uniref:DUF5677 domain-containing protein n=1 Tax=Granulicella sp. S190 TaxID=1747226 RepID=UPI0020B14896|nr:DUF5677 domain-containing protein [Granulicella sp. S190]
MHDSVELGRALQRLLWSRPIKTGSFGFEFAVSYVLFLRAERSLASIRTLVRSGLGDDAMALVRVMVEKIITAEYILLVGWEAASDYIQYLPFSEWRNYEDLRLRNPKLCHPYTPDQLKQLQSAHDTAKTKILPNGTSKPRYGRGNDWTEISLSKRAKKVDQLLKERHFTGSTETLFDATYKKSAAYLHGSFASIGRSIETRENEDQPPSDAELQKIEVGLRIREKAPQIGLDALKAANLAAFQVLAFLSQVLEDKKSRDWASSYARKKMKRSKTKTETKPEQKAKTL